jgi:hypothetical protein
MVKNGVFGMLCHMALVITDVSEELSTSINSVTRIGELWTALAVTSNRRWLRRNTKWEAGVSVDPIVSVRVYVVMELKEPRNGVMVPASKERASVASYG